MPNRIDLHNTRFGSWTVLGVSTRKFSGAFGWDCKCVCGTIRAMTTAKLRTGTSSSCGCRRSVVRGGKYWHTHGEADKTPEYRAWANMLSRCNNPNHPKYPNYGGRGIDVCSRWSSFSAFLADMGRRPTDKHSIERLDNNAGYRPANCVWATAAQQMRNRRCSLSKKASR